MPHLNGFVAKQPSLGQTKLDVALEICRVCGVPIAFLDPVAGKSSGESIGGNV